MTAESDRRFYDRSPVKECSRLLPDVRWLTLSPKAIVEASPLYIQPYLRLIRLDQPIGMSSMNCCQLDLFSAFSVALLSYSTRIGRIRLQEEDF